MSRIMPLLASTLLLLVSPRLVAENTLGYISYMTTNIGDDIQTIAARRFLPPDSCAIDRELIGAFDSDTIVHTLVNGWYMHTKELDWYRPDIPAPEKSWPPAPCIDPFFISIYFWDAFDPIAFSEESIEYLKKHAPIGARDYTTLKKLQDRGIPSYFSGCLTLTLDNPYKGEREDVVYAVDVTPETLEFLRANAECPVVELTHGITRELFFENDLEKRLEHVNTILEKYQRAKCVVTERLHAAMPCLALQTPVLFISPKGNGRLHGLRELTHHCSEEELLAGKSGFDLNIPPENPEDYLIIREQLIETVSRWVESYTQSQ